MKKQISKLFTINIYDVFKGLIVALLTALSDFIVQAFQMWKADHAYKFDFTEFWYVIAIAALSYLVKQFFTGTKQPLEDIKPDPLNPRINE